MSTFLGNKSFKIKESFSVSISFPPIGDSLLLYTVPYNCFAVITLGPLTAGYNSSTNVPNSVWYLVGNRVIYGVSSGASGGNPVTKIPQTQMYFGPGQQIRLVRVTNQAGASGSLTGVLFENTGF